jgi:hypothetical protein
MAAAVELLPVITHMRNTIQAEYVEARISQTQPTYSKVTRDDPNARDGKRRTASPRLHFLAHVGPTHVRRSDEIA